MRLRPFALDDCRAVYDISNDPSVRQASFSTDPIPYEEHRVWYKRAVSSAQPYYVVEADGAVVGYVRFDGEEISVAVTPSFRGRGLAAKAIRSACEFRGGTVHARIRSYNAASRRAFARAGFREAGWATEDGHRFLRMIWP